MSTEQLQAAAAEALRENRMYAPAGANAMEYYLALRDKQPDAAHVTSALTDLLPYALIAAEQGIARQDFAEAQRLYALLEKANPRFPALPRLNKSIADAQEAAVQRESAQATAREQAAAQRQAELLERQQAAERQAAAEAAAAEQRAADQQVAAARQESERQAAAARAAEQERAAAAAPPAPSPPAPAAAPPAPVLKPVNTPSPRYPPEALRMGTGGEVVLEFTVGTNGSVDNIRVVRSEPARVFDREAVNAMRRWKFEPIDAPVTIRRTISFDPD